MKGDRFCCTRRGIKALNWLMQKSVCSCPMVVRPGNGNELIGNESKLVEMPISKPLPANIPNGIVSWAGSRSICGDVLLEPWSVTCCLVSALDTRGLACICQIHGSWRDLDWRTYSQNEFCFIHLLHCGYPRSHLRFTWAQAVHALRRVEIWWTNISVWDIAQGSPILVGRETHISSMKPDLMTLTRFCHRVESRLALRSSTSVVTTPRLSQRRSGASLGRTLVSILIAALPKVRSANKALGAYIGRHFDVSTECSFSIIYISDSLCQRT